MKQLTMLAIVALLALMVHGCGKKGATEEATQATKDFVDDGVNGAAKGVEDAEKAVGDAVRDADKATFGSKEADKAKAATEKATK